jgi:phosphoribosylformylglycinamidine (FGAM) synthase PurS component
MIQVESITRTNTGGCFNLGLEQANDAKEDKHVKLISEVILKM